MDKEQIQKALAKYSPKPISEKRSYAVFIPLLQIEDEWYILYQVRSQLVSQAGEVSFPGGRIECGETSCQAALRETAEELQIRQEQVDIWGELDFLVYQEQTIYSFIGQLHIEDWKAIVPNQEVERLFLLPLKELQANPPTYYPLTSIVQPSQEFPFERIAGGLRYPFRHMTGSIPFYNSLSENIWGLTAQLTEHVVNFLSSY